MDLNYILYREQFSLYRAATSKDMAVRAVHLAFARAYGRILDNSTFPHRLLQTDDEGCPTGHKQPEKEKPIFVWENEGGHLAAPTASCRSRSGTSQLKNELIVAFDAGRSTPAA